MSGFRHPCLTSLPAGKVFAQRTGGRMIVAASIILFVIFVLPMFAQDDSLVHIMPRVNARNCKAADITISDPSLNNYSKPLRLNVQLVLVPLTVTDAMGRPFLGLEKQNFEVYEGKQKQSVRNLSLEDDPVSVGIIFDMSRSMKNKFAEAKDAVVQFMRTANLEDEFFLVAFSDEIKLLTHFTSSAEDIQNKLIFTEAHGETTLLDAIAVGMSEMKNAKYQRKALLIISDGGDNHSRYTESEIKSSVEEADVQLFAMGIFDNAPLAPEERYGPTLLSTLTNVTGGTTFYLNRPSQLSDVASKIGSLLRRQYVLAFTPLTKRNDGKWHTIRVKLAPPGGVPRLTVHAKPGYYARE